VTLGVIVLLTGAAVALAIDVPLARWCDVDGNCPKLIRNLLHCAEPFGHALGVLLIGLAVWHLDRVRRRATYLVLAAAWGAGLAADVVKMLIARARPKNADLSGDVWSTFGDWLPMLSGGSAGQSFPSAHTATAVALAIVLSLIYPAGRRFFLLMALLVACQRVESGFHYPSDVLVGAAVGLVVGTLAVKYGWRLSLPR
jgi:membrane-associated phospholipid phosphatase